MKTLPKRNDHRGAAYIELAYVLPVMALIFIGCIRAVRLLEAFQTASMMSREIANIAFHQCITPTAGQTVDQCLQASLLNFLRQRDSSNGQFKAIVSIYQCPNRDCFENGDPNKPCNKESTPCICRCNDGSDLTLYPNSISASGIVGGGTYNSIPQTFSYADASSTDTSFPATNYSASDFAYSNSQASYSLNELIRREGSVVTAEVFVRVPQIAGIFPEGTRYETTVF